MRFITSWQVLLKFRFCRLLENVKDIFIPVLWFNQHAIISEDLANQAKLLIMLPTVGEGVGYGFIGIACILVLVGAFLVVRQRMKGSEEEQLLNVN